MLGILGSSVWLTHLKLDFGAHTSCVSSTHTRHNFWKNWTVFGQQSRRKLLCKFIQYLVTIPSILKSRYLREFLIFLLEINCKIKVWFYCIHSARFRHFLSSLQNIVIIPKLCTEISTLREAKRFGLNNWITTKRLAINIPQGSSCNIMLSKGGTEYCNCEHLFPGVYFLKILDTEK